MTRSNTAIFILLMTACTFSGAAYAVDAVEEIKVCTAITDQEERLACFDKLGEQVLRAAPVDTEPTQETLTEPEAKTGIQPLPEDLGSAQTVQYVGFVTSCKKGPSGDWFFFFENGQVWKEVRNRNLRFKDCNSSATITRDAFGYKMQMDGVKKTVRVRRHR